ncbi:MAG: acyl-CoA dehydrogenase, partial [Alphaproteobacteria bacterium]
VDACEAIGRKLATADADDKLAASYPFLTMLSVATCGWLMERQGGVAGSDDFGRMKAAAVRFYLDQIVPEAMGLNAAANASAAVLYSIEADLFVA